MDAWGGWGFCFLFLLLLRLKRVKVISLKICNSCQRVWLLKSTGARTWIRWCFYYFRIHRTVLRRPGKKYWSKLNQLFPKLFRLNTITFSSSKCKEKVLSKMDGWMDGIFFSRLKSKHIFVTLFAFYVQKLFKPYFFPLLNITRIN